MATLCRRHGWLACDSIEKVLSKKLKQHRILNHTKCVSTLCKRNQATLFCGSPGVNLPLLWRQRDFHYHCSPKNSNTNISRSLSVYATSAFNSSNKSKILMKPGTRLNQITTRYCHTEVGTRGSTIFSLSSGHGKCGVAVIRVSGPKTLDSLRLIAQFKATPPPRQAFVRKLVDPDTGIEIDRALVLYFQGPSSFTGEDCAEFQVHGGPAVVSALLTALYKVPTCRQAEQGEFTKRAFMNGKLDLTEVEGLGDLIHAETEAQRRQALRQMEGSLTQLYQSWRRHIIKCVADLEAFLDFSEDQDIEEQVVAQVQEHVSQLRKEIIGHLNDNRQGERLRNGVQVAIVGKPNVGKSSLLNAICQRPAAIVTDVAGTTRDVIEAHMNIGGYPVLLVDTAGLRPTDDVVETEGVRRAIARAKHADLKLVVLDVSELPQWNLQNSDANLYILNMLKEIDVFDDLLPEEDYHYKSEQGYTSESMCSNKSGSLCSQLCSTGKMEYDQIKLVEFLKNAVIVFNKSDTLSNNSLDLFEQSLVSWQKLNSKIGQLKSDDAEIIPERMNVLLNYQGTVNSQFNCYESYKKESRGQDGKADVFEKVADDITNPEMVAISCTTGHHLEDLMDVLKNKVEKLCGNPLEGHPSITQARHRAHLQQCVMDIDGFFEALEEGDIVLASEALRRGLREIGKLTGRITSEDILDVIFKDFCIGK